MTSLLAHRTWPSLRDAQVDLAVLPWGATEAHNTHLPYATDTIQAVGLSQRAAEHATARGARVVVLPAIPFGVQTGQRELPLCINLDPTTQLAILRNVADTLVRSGVPKLVIVNGHGGNDFRWMIRELQGTVPLLIAQVNWWQCVDAKAFFDEPGDHAGELETSVMMHLVPELVRPISEAGPGTARPFTIRGFREGWAWTPRHWVRVTDDTGVGNPRAATADKGERFVHAVTARLGDFFAEFAATADEGMYER